MRDTIDNREAIEMMQRVIADIKQLRNQRTELEPKAEAYEVIKAIIGLLPKQSWSRGYGEDLVWVLEKRIRELSPQEPPSAPGAM